MSGIKRITDLPESSRPYTGEEKLLIVQDGFTTTNTFNSLTNYLSAQLYTDSKATLASLSSNWQNTYTNVASNSANWQNSFRTATGGISANNNTIVREALVGDVTAPASSNITTISDDVVTNAKLANMAEATFKGRLSGVGIGDPQDLSVSQVQSLVVTSSAVQTAISTADDTHTLDIRNSLRLSDSEIQDSINWQPNCITKLALSGVPLRSLIVGDSLSTGLRTSPNMMPNGVIGLSRTSTVTNVSSVIGGNIWLAPYHIIGTGGSAVYHQGGQGISFTPVGVRANTMSVMFIGEPTAGTFEIDVSSDNGATYLLPALTANANYSTQVGVVSTFTLNTSNSPKYIMRIRNVTGSTPLKIIGTGLYNSDGFGCVELRALANLDGIDVVNFGAIPDAIFTPLWSFLNVDLVISNFADAPEDWKENKLVLSNVTTSSGSNIITFSPYPPTEYSGGNAYLPFPKVGDYIVGNNIPPNTRILSHTKDTQTATITNNATGSGTSNAVIRGAFVAFYDRCKSINPKTDFVQFSMNPVFAPVLAGHRRWINNTQYLSGERVTMFNADGSLTPAPSGQDDGVYVCKLTHTSALSTKPESGVSWSTVWDEDFLDPASITAGTNRARFQATEQRAWAIRENETFINGIGMYRDYGSAVAAGMMSTPDQVHPTAVGHAYKNVMLWSKIPLSRLFLGTMGSYALNDASQYTHIFGMTTNSHPNNGQDNTLVEFFRPLRVSGQHGQMNLGDRTSTPNANADVSFQNTGGELSIQSFGGFMAIGGRSSFTGWHPGFNGSTLGGRSSNWWNLGGAGLRLEYHAVTTNATISSSNYTINVTSNNVTVQLPAATVLNSANFANAGAGAMGKVYCVKNSGSDTVTLSANGAQLINSSNTILLTSSQMVKVQSTGTGWITIM